MANLFTSQTPVVPDGADGAPGITTATTMRFGVAGQVTGIRFYASTVVSGTYTGLLYRVDAADTPSPAGTLLASKTMGVAPTAGTWNTISFDVGDIVTITPNTVLYRAALFSGAGRYVATTSFFTSDLVNGDITADANGDDPIGLGTLRNGSFAINAAATFPSSGGGSAYFVDVEFSAGAVGGVAPDGISVPVSLGSPSVALAGVAPSGLAAPVTLGAPTVVTPETVAGDTEGDWDGLLAVIESARADAEINRERLRNPVECPYDGWPLQRSGSGALHCLFGGHVITPSI